jgi:hypothetical protein
VISEWLRICGYEISRLKQKFACSPLQLTENTSFSTKFWHIFIIFVDTSDSCISNVVVICESAHEQVALGEK